MIEYTKGGAVGAAAMKSGMDRKTARKYIKAGGIIEPSKSRHWRTRKDPFAKVWPEVEALLSEIPELEAQTIFEHLCRENPEKFGEGQLRTLQRRVRKWRAMSGPPKEVFFPQSHRPGEAAQTDFTWATELGITICGEVFAHMLCHFVLPYSNWSSVTICFSESLLALRHGIQSALFKLGHVPQFMQTDNSTAATHSVGGGERSFNKDYLCVMRHFGMKPRTIGVGKSEQNGDVEAANGALKRHIEQQLLMRGSRDFISIEEYDGWLQDILSRLNGRRKTRLTEDLAAMKQLCANRLPQYKQEKIKVTSYSTVRAAKNAYSVPCRLIGEWVDVRIYDSRIEVHYGGTVHCRFERLGGDRGHRIDYRHIIDWLVRKPGAFERYRYREDLFPTLVFRRAYDSLMDSQPNLRKANIEYLRILKIAAAGTESTVENALLEIESTDTELTSGGVKAIVEKPQVFAVPHIPEHEVDLRIFDALLEKDAVA